MSAAPSKTVQFYPPFTHYEAADLIRVFSGALAVSVALVLMLLAHRRWDEDRRSAALFLIGLAAAMLLESTATSLVTLGRPPVWWLIIGRIVVIAISAVGCWVVVGEAKRGAWARRT